MENEAVALTLTYRITELALPFKGLHLRLKYSERHFH